MEAAGGEPMAAAGSESSREELPAVDSEPTRQRCRWWSCREDWPAASGPMP
jgi:hypothetical protein